MSFFYDCKQRLRQNCGIFFAVFQALFPIYSQFPTASNLQRFRLCLIHPILADRFAVWSRGVMPGKSLFLSVITFWANEPNRKEKKWKWHPANKLIFWTIYCPADAFRKWKIMYWVPCGVALPSVTMVLNITCDQYLTNGIYGKPRYLLSISWKLQNLAARHGKSRYCKKSWFL